MFSCCNRARYTLALSRSSLFLFYMFVVRLSSTNFYYEVPISRHASNCQIEVTIISEVNLIRRFDNSIFFSQLESIQKSDGK